MAEQTFRIPLINEPQRFNISLNEVEYTMISRYNPEMPNWMICMINAITQEPIFTCLPLVTGVDLLSQFRHTGITGSLIVYTDGNGGAIPTLENLGLESNLYYLVDDGS
jgi:hypothetical protein